MTTSEEIRTESWTHEIFASQKSLQCKCYSQNLFTVQSLSYWALINFLLHAKVWDFHGSHCYS